MKNQGIHTPKDIIKSFQKSVYDQYEANLAIPTLNYEQSLMICVKYGRLDDLDEILNNAQETLGTAGTMSKDPLKQSQFMVVSGLTLITRYAISGGLSPVEAFNLSDAYLQKLDNTYTEEAALELFLSALYDFTARVNKLQDKNAYSYTIERCIHYIRGHLHERINLETLSKHCKVTEPYLSAQFHKEVGMTISAFIRNEKLEIACSMLKESDYPIGRIASILDFPSASAFSTYFKNQYGILPKEYRRLHTEHV